MCVAAPAPRTDTTAMDSASNQTATGCVLALQSATVTMCVVARQSWMRAMSAAALGMYVCCCTISFDSTLHLKSDVNYFSRKHNSTPLLLSISSVLKLVSIVPANVLKFEMYVGYVEVAQRTITRVR